MVSYEYSINNSTTENSTPVYKTPDVQQVWLSDDASASGKICSLHEWYEHLIVEGVKNGYYINGAKSWLIVNSKKL